ncbi:TRAP transporter large permease [Propylenella binzhouense]|uniref:TRAP transporter large permease protein n=1 Tax=Propylenella binzhouense TaxID=2555902 RepID=A0A964T3K0_9HYPH|nr:TRAP transporter large permease [Propylenella binzhouense]MYZ46902.1 TRAP transporter large permease [Propylenella binzhouense]
MLAASIGFLCAFALIFLRVPVAIALAVVGAIGFAIVNGATPAMSMLALITSGSTMSYYLSVIPLFILMGNLVAGAGISADLYRAGQAFLGHWRGGLAMATIVSCGGFAAVCGSSVATAVTMGKVSIPSMRSYGYSNGLSAATVAAGGTLGILIPPSIIMVVYGVSTETHIGQLFAAGLLPGFLGVVGYALAVRWTVFRKPESAPPAERATTRERLEALRRIWTVAALFVLVLGGIYTGLFTATEAGGIGSVGALAFAIARRVSLREFYEILKDTVQTTAILFALIIGATIFGEFINLTGSHRAILELVGNSELSPYTVILIITVIYVLLGCVLDSLAMMLLTLPMFFPIVVGLGFDPVWFGIFVVMLVELGLITPPIGMNLFILRSIAPEVPLATIIRGIMPFIVSDVARILLIIAFPSIVLILPRLFFG